MLSVSCPDEIALSSSLYNTYISDIYNCLWTRRIFTEAIPQYPIKTIFSSLFRNVPVFSSSCHLQDQSSLRLPLLRPSSDQLSVLLSTRHTVFATPKWRKVFLVAHGARDTTKYVPSAFSLLTKLTSCFRNASNFTWATRATKLRWTRFRSIHYVSWTRSRFAHLWRPSEAGTRLSESSTNYWTG